MFVHKHQLEYLLDSIDYTSEERRQAEIQTAFLPAWHLAGTKSELPKDGDFLTFELFGHPVQIRRAGGGYYAVENTCAHRHCVLTSLPKGNSPTIRCQYHGWEYEPTGKTGKIPDAGCFRPWDRDTARLNTYRVETVGDLIFIALSEEAPPLKEFLDPFVETVEEYFTAPTWKLKDIWEYEAPCNWKVPAENTLETYHIPHIHPKSFNGIYPSEQKTDHFLHDRYTTLAYDTSEDATLAVWQRRIAGWLGTTPSDIHIHRHIHPHTIINTSPLFSYIVNYLPIAPDRTRVRLRMYSYRGAKRNPFTAMLAWGLAILSRRIMRKIMSEDLGIFADQQRGLSTSRHKGVIGTREERIYVFQRFLLEKQNRWPKQEAEMTEMSLAGE
jgi:phenylpropionate dioxygenase-like ring-hydroxylating dioxygenase large terminal subunit